MIKCKLDPEAPGQYDICGGPGAKAGDDPNIETVDAQLPIEVFDERYEWEERFVLGSVNTSLVSVNENGEDLIFPEETIYTAHFCSTVSDYLDLGETGGNPLVIPSDNPTGHGDEVPAYEQKKYCFIKFKKADLTVEEIQIPDQVQTGTQSFPVITKNIGEFKCCEVLYMSELFRGEEYLGGGVIFATYECVRGPFLPGFEPGETFDFGTGNLELTESGTYTVRINVHCEVPGEENDDNGVMEKTFTVV